MLEHLPGAGRSPCGRLLPRIRRGRLHRRSRNRLNRRGRLGLLLKEFRDPLAELPEEAASTRHRPRSEEHTSELQSLMRISYAVFCLKKKKKQNTHTTHHTNNHSTTTYTNT